MSEHNEGITRGYTLSSLTATRPAGGAFYGIRPHRPMTEAVAAQSKRLAELPVPQEQIDQIVRELMGGSAA